MIEDAVRLDEDTVAIKTPTRVVMFRKVENAWRVTVLCLECQARISTSELEALLTSEHACS